MKLCLEAEIRGFLDKAWLVYCNMINILDAIVITSLAAWHTLSGIEKTPYLNLQEFQNPLGNFFAIYMRSLYAKFQLSSRGQINIVQKMDEVLQSSP